MRMTWFDRALPFWVAIIIAASFLSWRVSHYHQVIVVNDRSTAFDIWAGYVEDNLIPHEGKRVASIPPHTKRRFLLRRADQSQVTLRRVGTSDNTGIEYATSGYFLPGKATEILTIAPDNYSGAYASSPNIADLPASEKWAGFGVGGWAGWLFTFLIKPRRRAI